LLLLLMHYYYQCFVTFVLHLYHSHLSHLTLYLFQIFITTFMMEDQRGTITIDIISLIISLPLLLLLLSTPLSYLGLITAPHSILVSLLCVWAASSALSALPRAS